MLRLRKFMFDRVYLGPDARREHERVERTMRGLFDHYVEHPDDLPRWDAEASDVPARHRLHRRDDRPLLHRPVHRPDDPRGGALLVALISRREPRPGQAGGRHRRGDLGPHRPAPRRRPLDRALPLPRRAHAVVLGRRPGKALPLLRLRGRRRRDQVRRREGRARLRRGGRAAGRPLRGRDRARAGGPAGGGPAPAAAPPRAAAGAGRRLLRQLSLGGAGGGQGARVSGRARPLASRCCASSASASPPAPGTRSSSAASRPASAPTSCTGSASSSATATGASTTASARGSCSRSATAAAASSASAAGRCAPTRAPST